MSTARQQGLRTQLNDKLAAWLDAMFSDISETCELSTTLDEYCDLVTEKATFGRIAGGRYVSTETIGANKQGIKEFGSTRLDERVTHFIAGDTLMGNIRPYFKKVYFATVEGGCNGDVLCFRPKRAEFAPIVYAAMFQDAFFDYVMSGAKGTKMPRGDKQHILKYPVPLLGNEEIDSLYLIASNVQRLETRNQQEARTLEALTSAMLTTLSAR